MTPVLTVKLSFLESEDRLILDLGMAATTETVLLTRRLTRRLITGVARILARQGSLPAHVPACHKTEMLVWEHLSARQPARSDDADAFPVQSGPRPPPPCPLLSRLDIQIRGEGFHLCFENRAGGSRALIMSRGELHRLLASLRQLARLAAWDLDGEVDWLQEADSPTLQHGSLAS